MKTFILQKITYKTFIMWLLCALLVICALWTSVTSLVAYAVDDNAFDNTYIMDDLNSSTIDGEAFDIHNYPFNDNVDVKYGVKMLNFVEYCYTYRVNTRDDFGLYLYLWNVKGVNIDVNDQRNKVEMAVAYDTAGNPSRYEKFNVKFCSKSNNSLFYKFKVIDRKIDGKYIVDRVNSIDRQYDVAGIELMTKGAINASDYYIGGKYIFNGYAKGCGVDVEAESDLKCNVGELETLNLDINKTYYRTNVSSAGKGHYNEVNTVYFAVPERIFQKYGTLQKIRAEWWEFKTQMAAVTSNKAFCDELMKYVGTDVGAYSSNVPIGMSYNTSYSSSFGHISYYSDWSYNKNHNTSSSSYVSGSTSTIMPYAFHSPVVDIDVDTVFDFLYSDPVAGDVDSTIVSNWIYNYSNTLGHGFIDCNGRQISKDLFMDSVDTGRTKGHNDKTIDLGDTFDLFSYDSNHSWWKKLFEYGFSWPETDGDYRDIPPIYELKAGDLIGTNDTIADKLLVNSNDVSSLKTFYAEATTVNPLDTKDEKCRVMLFRFADTDYFCVPVGRHGNSGTASEDRPDTYIAQQTVFFDFDIIEMTFNENGVYHVIPVVSDPIDIINDFTQPPRELEWWKILLAVLLFILFFVILMPVLPYVIKFIFWLIRLPFKVLCGVFKGCKKFGHKLQGKDNPPLETRSSVQKHSTKGRGGKRRTHRKRR